ncbi:hypothetical protein [Pigmentiphaga litoralis]|uniref:Mannose-6-phosphate isomerase-like protein (Cupin superfamily) n=1 Tax=Pigmentiphaga litoralis TaxID=516702 RepID=A0A7Y9LM02_9BURK|nr:hypothetical protein [Pigmentiphaga litoralis]NYE24758.1 mannose-6-phosphate isomerase-like protein (cupin superfamily) [Pigmentiphaga litoralis]NYE81628.1 mannose-6-phosphate isomerase-like protein (cupin superfamily) [Pigmentiphaga litoralis]
MNAMNGSGGEGLAHEGAARGAAVAGAAVTDATVATVADAAATRAEHAGSAHCLRVDAGAKWRAADAAGQQFDATGKAFDVAIRVFAEGETVSADADAIGEEVAAVLEGQFHVDAAGESYDLARGEAIVIPEFEARTWRCTSARGVLYRVLVREPGVPEDEAAAVNAADSVPAAPAMATPPATPPAVTSTAASPS